jgi:predicted transcriptional regulator
MSRRDLAHVLTALWDLSAGRPDVPVEVADIDEAIGRGRRDMRTPLNLQSLAEQGLVVEHPGGGWALTQEGVDWIVQDRELSDR